MLRLEPPYTAVPTPSGPEISKKSQKGLSGPPGPECQKSGEKVPNNPKKSQKDYKINPGREDLLRQNLVIQTFFCVFCPFFLVKCRENKGREGKMRRKRFRLRQILPFFETFWGFRGSGVWRRLYMRIAIVIFVQYLPCSPFKFFGTKRKGKG